MTNEMALLFLAYEGRISYLRSERSLALRSSIFRSLGMLGLRSADNLSAELRSMLLRSMLRSGLRSMLRSARSEALSPEAELALRLGRSALLLPLAALALPEFMVCERPLSMRDSWFFGRVEKKVVQTRFREMWRSHWHSIDACCPAPRAAGGRGSTRLVLAGADHRFF